MTETYIVASIGDWNREIFTQVSATLDGNWHYVDKPDELVKLLESVTPLYIFFPHWRWVVPANIVERYECVCFHMTDLPYGRGGSPLQNLILAGFKYTKVSALRMVDALDAGPIYLKEPLSLQGSAAEIYQRAAEICWKIIALMIKQKIIPQTQKGEPTFFKRRQPQESQIPTGLTEEKLYDFIRMLDAPGYPKAFLQLGKSKLIFEQAKFEAGELTAKISYLEGEESHE